MKCPMERKYIAFARCFKPKISDEAAAELVREYKKLRMSDTNNAATSSWINTIRQLESLVRLSEALARLHCGREVKAEHIDPAKLKLKYEDYKKMSDVLILHMRADEDKLGDEDYGGVKQSELVDWYFNTIEEDLGSEEDYLVQKTVVPLQVFRGDGTDGSLWSVEELLKQYETNSSWVVDAKT
ncbi:unnamed protein product [Caenorhabditis bovis]|uniref:Uncharacterized protein n=1 Tax=Caenorhabditis bovis TaxID=2654633 RepID=A0A8S1EGY8_9PELO|nr:unnamed protein product [Caenorhabditis bovis]